MTGFVPARQSRSYACDLIMCLHYVLRMYDRLTALEPGGFMVRAKKRAGGRRRKQKQQEVEGEEGEEGGKGEEDEEGGGDKEGGDAAARKHIGKAPLEQLAENSGEEVS
jgi:hypothetical protein